MKADGWGNVIGHLLRVIGLGVKPLSHLLRVIGSLGCGECHWVIGRRGEGLSMYFKYPELVIVKKIIDIILVL